MSDRDANALVDRVVADSIVDARAALARRDEARLSTACTMVAGAHKHMTAAQASEIDRVCYVEEPRLHLEVAVADARHRQGQTPELGNLGCMQLFLGEAFDALALHPPTDPGLQKLVAEYAQLCPEQTAKLRARPRPVVHDL